MTGAMPATGIPCRVCGGPTRAYLVSRDFNRRVSESNFSYLRCQDCGSISLTAPPEDLDRYYPTDYYMLPGSRQDLADSAEHERYKLDIVQKFVPGGRLLEIGPAVGGFAYLAKQAGFDVETVEMDHRCCEYLRDVVGVGAIETSNSVAVLKRSPSLQVVALWHVLEHLPDPMETLEAAAEALSPGGILVIGAPNPQAMQFALFRSRWAHLDCPRHLQLIPASHVRERAASWGLATVLETTTDPGGLGWNSFGWKMSLDNVVGLNFPGLVAKILCRLARPIERSGMRGCAYTLVLRKGSP